MGVVWAAEDIATHQHNALKLMKEAAGDPGARQRLLREARAASAVRHPNVVRILDVLELDDQSPVIVMELLEGESLQAMLARERTLPLAELAEIMVPVVSAIGTAHALGIVHRDLKPENIFLARGPAGERVVKILDFGIAKLTALDGEAMRSTGLTTTAVLRTPAYMAPEQVFGEKDLDHRADIWALGIVFYQCLSGVLPTAGDNVGQTLKNVLAKPFEPLDHLVSDLPQETSQLVARMLARERSQRPADLREVLELLERFASTPGVRFGAPAARLLSADAPTVMLRIAPRDGGFVGNVASPATTPAPAPRPRRARSVLRNTAVVALLGMGVAGWRWARSSAPGPQPTVVRSPLVAPDAKLACPILEASGVDEPTGWLGAAAAATVCERARVILGGRPERTLVPAELLVLPRKPVDDFPADPYGKPEARERSVAEARRQASAYIDGKVLKTPQGFRVTLVLHATGANELARSEGSGRGLYEAVRAAMAPLVRADLLPRAEHLDADIAAWSRTQDVDAALALLDLTFAMAHNAGGLKDECTRFEQMSSHLGELGAAGRWLCAYTMGLPAPRVDLDTSDPSAEGYATRARIRHLVHPEDAPGTADRLHELYERNTTSWGQSLIAATESCVVQSTDPKRASDMAFIAVEAEPKNPDGQLCDPWGQLVTTTRDQATADNATRAMQAWAPWSSVGWWMQGRATGDPVAVLIPLRRAYDLTPFNTAVAGDLADRLLAAGKREDARGVAREVGMGKLPVNQVESDLLLLRVEASEAKFKAALDQAQKAFDISSDDTGWVRVQRFEAAWRALELAAILGGTRELADGLVQRFLDPEPPLLDGTSLPVSEHIAAICTLASAPVSKRCFARFRELRGRLSGGITPETDRLLSGAEHYARQDLAGAARVWRPLLRGSGTLASVLPDAMVEAFEHTGNPELAEEVDRLVMDRAGEFNGATLGHVRAAQRALRQGDHLTARALAKQVIAAWQVADELPPTVADMQRLLKELPEP